MSVGGLQEVLEVLHGDGPGTEAALHFAVVVVGVAEVGEFFEYSVRLYLRDPLEYDRLVLGGHFNDLRGSVLSDRHLVHLFPEVGDLLILLVHDFLKLTRQLVAVLLA